MAYTSEQQWAPLWRHAGSLQRQLGLVLVRRQWSAGQAVPEGWFSGCDLIGLKLDFKTPADQAVRLARQAREISLRQGSRVLYFDGDDDPNVQWPEVLAAVDLYVKKHMFVEPQAYLRRYLGKSNLTDHLAASGAITLGGHAVASSGPLSAAELPKVRLGWNIALDDKIHDLMQALPEPVLEGRSMDIVCRAYVAPGVWTHGLRAPAVVQLEGMASRFRVLAPRDRVDQATYYREMLDAKLCVSPFGFGEICWRDFEAILCGCVLVKPDMGHVRTSPNLFLPGETYLPVRWDFADLEAQCAALLADEPRRLAMVRRARELLLQALSEDFFVRRWEGLLGQPVVPTQAAAAPSTAG